MTSKIFWLLIGVIIGVTVFLLWACTPAPQSPAPTTTTASTSTTIPSGGTPVTSSSELQSVVSSGGHALVAQSISSLGTIFPAEGSAISFTETGVITRPESASGPAIDVSASDITLSNVHIEGTDECIGENTLPYNPDSIGEKYAAYDPPREHDHGIEVSPGADRLKINGVTINKVWGDAIYFDGGKDIEINNPQIRCAGRGGIVAVGVDGLVINGGNIFGTFWWALNFEPFGDHQIKNVNVNSTIIGFSRWQWLHAGAGEGANCQITAVNLSSVILLPESTRPSSISGCVYNQVIRPVGDVR